MQPKSEGIMYQAITHLLIRWKICGMYLTCITMIIDSHAVIASEQIEEEEVEQQT